MKTRIGAVLVLAGIGVLLGGCASEEKPPGPSSPSYVGMDPCCGPKPAPPPPPPQVQIQTVTEYVKQPVESKCYLEVPGMPDASLVVTDEDWLIRHKRRVICDAKGNVIGRIDFDPVTGKPCFTSVTVASNSVPGSTPVTMTATEGGNCAPASPTQQSNPPPSTPPTTPPAAK